MIFKMTHMYANAPPVTFNEDNAPKWLCEGGLAGSTMDNRWFWTGHVLTLNVGETVNTDYHTIERIQ